MKHFYFLSSAIFLAFMLTIGRVAADDQLLVIRYNTPIDSLKQLLEVKSLSEKREMDLYEKIAGLYHYFDHDSSVYYAHKSMSIAHKLKANKMLIENYCTLGVTHCFASNYDSSFIYFEKMQTLAAARRDQKNEIKAITMFGYTYAKQGKYHTALEYYLKVLKIYENEGSIEKCVGALVNISEINRRIGNTEMAIQYLQQAEEKCNSLKPVSNWHMPHICNEYAFNYLKKGDLDRTLYYALKADSINVGETAVNACDTKCLLATVYLKRSDYDRALKYAGKAFAYADELKDKNLYASAGKVLSDIYMALERYPEAEATALKVWEADSTFIDESRVVAKNIAMANIYMNRTERAAYFLDKYAELNDQYAEMNFQTIVSDLGVKYETNKKETRIVTLEKKQRVYLFIGLSGVTLALLLGFVLIQTIRRDQKERQLIASEAIQEGEIKERIRLTKDLHDRLGGSLAALKISLLNAESAQIISAKIDMCNDDLRDIMNNIIPLSLHNYGLKGAFEDFCANMSILHFHFFGEIIRLHPNLEYAIYCCAKELMINAIKHSGASSINLQLVQSTKHLSLLVQDDGKGFYEKTIKQGYGLRNIRNHVSAFRGKFDIVSIPGKGTEMMIELKYEKSLKSLFFKDL